jgi:hypothetical protein
MKLKAVLRTLWYVSVVAAAKGEKRMVRYLNEVSFV